jgi:hypothetical protein
MIPQYPSPDESRWAFYRLFTMRNPWLDIPLADYEAHLVPEQVDVARAMMTLRRHCKPNEELQKQAMDIGVTPRAARTIFSVGSKAFQVQEFQLQ